MASPSFVCTNAGLVAASTASPTGPWISITTFAVGSGYNYTPTNSDTAFHGSTLYSGTPTSYKAMPDGSLDIVCELPPQAGPFQFGEIGLFLQDGTLFALAAFDTLQTKYSSLGSNSGSGFEFNCLMKLEQSVAIFQISTAPAVTYIYDVYQWSDVYPPGVSANPNVPIYLVHELSGIGSDSTVLSNASATQWTVDSTYQPYIPANANTATPTPTLETFTVVSATTTSVTVAATQMHPADLKVINRQMLLETPDGYFRSVSGIVASGSNYQINLNCTNDGTYKNIPLPKAPAANSAIRLYRTATSGGIYYSQIIDPPAAAPAPPLGTASAPGLMQGGNGLAVASPGQLAAYGLLHAPSANTGRLLTNNDDLHDQSLPSGVYNIVAAKGIPANYPPVGSVAGVFLLMHGTDTPVHMWFPNGGAGLQYPPPYYESFDGGQGRWTGWIPFYAKGTTNTVNGMVQSSSAQAIGNYTVQSLIINNKQSNGVTANLSLPLPQGANSAWWSIMAVARPAIFKLTLASTTPAYTLYINGQQVDATTVNVLSPLMGVYQLNTNGPVTIPVTLSVNNFATIGGNDPANVSVIAVGQSTS